LRRHSCHSTNKNPPDLVSYRSPNGGRAMRLVCCFLLAMSGAALAQTTGAIPPVPAATQQSPINEDVPPGGCMPLGVTASGEIVFPFQCKELIEKHRGQDAEHVPAGEPTPPSEQVPAIAEEKPPSSKPQAVAVEEDPGRTVPDNKPAKALSRAAEHGSRTRYRGSVDCQRFRTYDQRSGSYRGYDGRRRSCP
jgi:hypothetical protein